MLEFPISEYYLVSRFYNIPKPFLLWPIIFIIIYSAEGLVYILASEKSTYMDNYVLGLFSNAFFSIAYIFITIFLYKINIKGINEWIRSNKNISEDADLINRLNLYHKYFFGRYALLLIFLILALRRGVIQIVSPEYQFIFGYIINDTITLFLLLSSAITVLTFFIQIYIVSSQGIQVSQPFEINIKYRDLESLVIKNTFVTGIALGLYGGALILWGKNVNQENVAMLLNVMTFSFILITFFTGLLGIKTGKYLTKTNLLAILQKEITNYDFITQKNQTSLFKKTLMCLAYTNILHIMKDTEEIEEWSFNISSLIYLGVTIIVSIYIRHTIEYMFEIIDLL